jgi:hypothetical protein
MTVDVQARSRPPVAFRDGPQRPSAVSSMFAVVLNAALLGIVHRLPEWQWPAFLTARFEELLPLLTASFVASILVSLLNLVVDRPWLRSLGTLVTSAVAFAVAVATWRVFPFDFTGYDVDWTPVARIALVLSMVGTAISVAVEAARLLTMAVTHHGGSGHRTAASSYS